jgi:uncharacterized membrane protein
MSRDDTAVLGGATPDDYVRLSGHPRAQRAIKRAKSMGGIAGFVLSFFIAQKSGVAAFETGVRALVGGIAGYVLIWIAAIQVWRQIAIGEFKAAERRRAAQRQAQRERMDKASEDRKRKLEESRAERAGR